MKTTQPHPKHECYHEVELRAKETAKAIAILRSEINEAFDDEDVPFREDVMYPILCLAEEMERIILKLWREATRVRVETQ